MKFSQMYPSKYLKADDFDEPVVWRIKRISEETMGDGEMKHVCYFDECPRGMVLNVTNGRLLASLFGDDVDDCIGRQVEIVTILTDFQGKTVNALRLREVAKPKAKYGPRPAKKADKGGGDFADLNDEIPF
jgi:hypothetical protein